MTSEKDRHPRHVTRSLRNFLARWVFKPDLLFVLPAGLFAVTSFVAKYLGLEFKFAPSKPWWLLDPALLREDAIASLFLLHAQPPFMNVLTSLLLKVEAIPGLNVGTLASGIYWLFSLAALFFFYEGLKFLTQSKPLATVLTCVHALNPAVYLFTQSYNHTNPAHLMISVVFYGTARISSTGSHRDLAWAGTGLLLLSWVRPQYHPIFCCLYLVLLAGLVFWVRRPPWTVKHVILIVACFCSMICLWPLKNFARFGAFTNSTWIGYNFARNTPVRYQFEAGFNDVENLRKLSDGLHPVLSQLVKSEGGGQDRNWNHIWFVESSGVLAGDSIRFRSSNKAMYLKWAFCQYSMATRPGFYQVYSIPPLLEERLKKGFYAAFVRSYDRLLFGDLKPLLEYCGFGKEYETITLRSGDGTLHEKMCSFDEFVTLMANLSGCSIRPVRFSLYGFILLPGFFVLIPVLIVVRWKKMHPADVVAALCWVLVAWVLGTTCFSDGIEGARIRFACSSFNLVFLYYVVSRILSMKRFQPRHARNMNQESEATENVPATKMA